jgi:hypothetical protein
MDTATARVVRGYVQLDGTQRQDFVEIVNNFNQGRISRTFVLEEVQKIIRVNTGPVGGVCHCCGR